MHPSKVKRNATTAIIVIQNPAPMTTVSHCPSSPCKSHLHMNLQISLMSSEQQLSSSCFEIASLATNATQTRLSPRQLIWRVFAQEIILWADCSFRNLAMQANQLVH